jgi:hypothetical protein
MNDPSPSSRTNFYTILGVETFAPPTTVQRAYRQLVKTHHPDVISADARGASLERFKHITQAYAVLNDATTRTAYDEELRLTLLAVQAHVDEFKKRYGMKEEATHPAASASSVEASLKDEAPVPKPNRVETRDEAREAARRVEALAEPQEELLQPTPHTPMEAFVLPVEVNEHPLPLKGVVASSKRGGMFGKKPTGTVVLSPAQAMLGCTTLLHFPKASKPCSVQWPAGLKEGLTVEVQQGSTHYVYQVQIKWPPLPLSPTLQQAYEHLLLAEHESS